VVPLSHVTSFPRVIGDHDIAISSVASPLHWEIPNAETPNLRIRATYLYVDRRLSSIREIATSRFQRARTLSPRQRRSPICRYPMADGRLISATCLPSTDGSDHVGVFNLYFPDVFVHGNADFPMCQTPMALDPRHVSFCQRTVQIPSGFRNFRCLAPTTLRTPNSRWPISRLFKPCTASADLTAVGDLV
jgi:hypothetical protein